MKAETLADERHVLAENVFAEIVVQQVPRAVKGPRHRFQVPAGADGERRVCSARRD